MRDESDNSPIQVSSTKRFKEVIRQLAKQYPEVRLDIQWLIQRLESGELPGEKIPNPAQIVFHARVRNSDIQRGKSGGCRI